MIQLSRFLTVMLVAEWLPVGFVPEQSRITAMRFDVINVCCLHIPTLSHAFSAQRMTLPSLTMTKHFSTNKFKSGRSAMLLPQRYKPQEGYDNE